MPEKSNAWHQYRPEARHALRPSRYRAVPDAECTFPSRPTPGEQLRREKAVTPSNRRYRVSRHEALLDNLALRLRAEPTTSARVHDLQKLEIILGRSGVHTTCNHTWRRPSQGGPPRRRTLKLADCRRHEQFLTARKLWQGKAIAIRERYPRAHCLGLADLTDRRFHAVILKSLNGLGCPFTSNLPLTIVP